MSLMLFNTDMKLLTLKWGILANSISLLSESDAAVLGLACCFHNSTPPPSQ